MRISELLTAMASWLENPNNEAFLLAEYDEDCLKVVASSCVEAATLLKKAAEEVELLEPPQESALNTESVEGLANLAAALDSSGDPELMKQASVIDELLLTIAAPKNAVAERKDLLDQRLVELKKKYNGTYEALAESNKVADTKKAINKSKVIDQVPIQMQNLSSRSCPDHAGAQLARVGEHMWQCDLDKKIYDYEAGFTLNNGTKVPGGDVSLQTQHLNVPSHSVFDTRESRLLSNKA